ncbi:hypothetical protein DER46DRAFT_579781 [Fusarium sp. MPI-SDFR-AT-0072]|nr:hypothetical protein DER46DRAFT_579781 [Fusarium sp. MPI-SDFR-AT-0072]
MKNNCHDRCGEDMKILISSTTRHRDNLNKVMLGQLFFDKERNAARLIDRSATAIRPFNVRLAEGRADWPSGNHTAADYRIQNTIQAHGIGEGQQTSPENTAANILQDMSQAQGTQRPNVPRSQPSQWSVVSYLSGYPATTSCPGHRAGPVGRQLDVWRLRTWVGQVPRSPPKQRLRVLADTSLGGLEAITVLPTNITHTESVPIVDPGAAAAELTGYRLVLTDIQQLISPGRMILMTRCMREVRVSELHQLTLPALGEQHNTSGFHATADATGSQ